MAIQGVKPVSVALVRQADYVAIPITIVSEQKDPSQRFFGSTETPLARIKTIEETKNHIFVIMVNGLGYIIPRREISSSELGLILEQLKMSTHQK